MLICVICRPPVSAGRQGGGHWSARSSATQHVGHVNGVRVAVCSYSRFPQSRSQ